LDNECFLQIYFNERTKTIAFALIKEEQRLWGIDFDSLRGWHVHPLENSKDHIAISPKNIKKIVQEFSVVWETLSQ